MSEIDDIRTNFARKIEDGKRVLSFASTDEWNWFVDSVIQPTIDEYVERMLKGTLPEREDLHIRGMIAGLKLVVDSAQTFIDEANKAREQSKRLEEELKDAD